jgi:D-amino-acid oxidase
LLVNTSFNRRNFLRGALATSAALMATRPGIAFDTKRHFAPVKVARDRVIREVVGLRPYRPGGFVVDAQRLGSKLLVHNYGHGGGGVTLSWGTASLAVDLMRDFLVARRSPRPARFAVLGCGVSGLSTARMLQRRYQNGPGTVTIYAKGIPPDTTSNVAGAWWSPTSVYEP